MTRFLRRNRVAALLLVLLASPAAGTADELDRISTDLDRVEDLFRSGSDLGPAMLDTALEQLDAAVKRDPASAKAHFLRGRAYAYRGEPGDDAIADASYARAAELAPDVAEYQFRHGLRLARAGKTQPALAAIRRAAELDPKHAEAALTVGVLHANAGDDAAALEWFGKVLALDERNAAAHGNIGQVYQDQGEHKQALAAYEKAAALAPRDWRLRAKLVQACQALGDTHERDRQRIALIEMWQDDQVDQPLFCREQFQSAGRKVHAYEHFQLRGDPALRYSFVVFKPDGKQPDYRVSLGSHKPATEAAPAEGETGKDDRPFHLDATYPGGERRTFGTFKKEPSYESTRIRVVEVLEGKLKPVSSDKPGEKRNLDIDVEVGE